MAEVGGGQALLTIYDIPQRLQGLAIVMIADAQHLEQQFLTALRDRNVAALQHTIQLIEGRTHEFNRMFIELVALLPGPAVPAVAQVAPAPQQQLLINNQRKKATETFAVQLAQLSGMHDDPDYALLSAADLQNNYAALISAMSLIMNRQFPDARFITEKDQQALYNFFCIKTWMSDPNNYRGKAATQLRLLLRPNDMHRVPLSEQEAFDLIWKALGAVTEPIVMTRLKTHLNQMYDDMEAGVFGELKFSRAKTFEYFLRSTLDTLHTFILPRNADVLAIFEANILELRETLTTKIAQQISKDNTNRLLDMEEKLANFNSGKSHATQKHQPGHATDRNAAQNRPSSPAIGYFGDDTSKVPPKPPGQQPDKPQAYPGQPCFAWVGGYCNKICPNKRPHEWGTSTPAQIAFTTKYCQEIKPWNRYFIYKSWADHGYDPTTFPHRIV